MRSNGATSSLNPGAVPGARQASSRRQGGGVSVAFLDAFGEVF
jgi:hypothetical protein